MSLTTAQYGETMMDSAEARPADEERGLRAHLARGDAMLDAALPVLRHLLAHEDSGMLSEDVVARVRGMIADLATALLDRMEAPAGTARCPAHRDVDLAALTAALAADARLLAHVHALALEWQLAERLQVRLGLDPVLSPLLRTLLASPDRATASLATDCLAAQARFGQAQRRMQLPLAELPQALLDRLLRALRAFAAGRLDGERRAIEAEAAIRGEFDETRGRLEMISRLASGLGRSALTISHAGVAIFATALAAASGQDRERAVLATSEGQGARLALALLAAGLTTEAAAEQLFVLNPDASPLPGFDRISADRAAALIARPAPCPGQ